MFTCADLEELGDELMPPLILWGSVEMPLVDAWDDVVGRAAPRALMQRVLAEIRKEYASAAQWHVHMDDFTLEWDPAANRYRPSAKLTPARYRQNVRFSRGS